MDKAEKGPDYLQTILEHWVPFFQTLLWVLLIFAVCIMFREQVTSLISIVSKRIKDGSGVKIGIVELAEQAEAQSPVEQNEKIDQEVADVVEEEASQTNAEPNIAAQNHNPDPAVIKTEAFIAEDLVLRDLQAEFSIPIKRQVNLGLESFDGVFQKGETLFVVEVKIANKMFETKRLREYLRRLSNGLLAQEYAQNVQIIYVVVYRSGLADIEAEYTRLSAIATVASEYRQRIEVRCYRLNDLANKWKRSI